MTPGPPRDFAGSAPQSTQPSIEAIWRLESPRLLAALVRITRDVDQAEDLAQEALVAAMEQWPRTGQPARPGAWLMTVAKRRAVDQIRHAMTAQGKHEQIARELAIDARTGDAWTRDIVQLADPDHVDDDVLRLMFLACHPALSESSRVALTLRLLGGLTTEEIARALLASPATVGQRLARAKTTLAAHREAFDNPDAAERLERVPAVMAVVYLIFNEGYSATVGADWARPDLCQEALRLGRVLVGLVPRDAEAWGLLALMNFQASRLAARTGSDGLPVLLLEQNRRLWDRFAINRGTAALDASRRLAGSRPGPYQLQAELAACHARAVVAQDTDWARIAELYAVLGRVQPSPVIELNRAVAVAHADGPEAALRLVDALAVDDALADYHLVAAVRADLLLRVGSDAGSAAGAGARGGTDRQRGRTVDAAAPHRGSAALTSTSSWISGS